MDLDVTIICRENLATGFGLTGAEAIAVAGPDEARRELFRRTSKRTWNLILVDEEIFSELSRDDRERLQDSTMPVIVPLHIQGALGAEDPEAAAKERVADLVQHAIGKRLAI